MMFKVEKEEVTPEQRTQTLKTAIYIHLAALVVFVLGIIFNNEIVTYPFIAIEWAAFFVAAATLPKPSNGLSVEEKRAARIIDSITFIVLICCSAWWTLFAFSGSWIFGTLREKKEVGNV
ncbi:hypothetical protein [Maridesulfovibrio ferrireducens]|uniref:hypothetical protein n=1 Tax=Maridesulfovibrio ferrireducens TaxID=246191 RepID=UPI001A329726|nr:hypothetical protein [Maridesulfovibrio ferrireducens]MBI9112420.1 hypothetical protein [Maridesulfovibrio ferrireducens]